MPTSQTKAVPLGGRARRPSARACACRTRPRRGRRGTSPCRLLARRLRVEVDDDRRARRDLRERRVGARNGQSMSSMNVRPCRLSTVRRSAPRPARARPAGSSPAAGSATPVQEREDLLLVADVVARRDHVDARARTARAPCSSSARARPPTFSPFAMTRSSASSRAAPAPAPPPPAARASRPHRRSSGCSM